MPKPVITNTSTSNMEFVAGLRSAVQRYLAAVDAWEVAYAKFYRLSAHNQVSSDLEPMHREYIQAHRELSEQLPRAKRLCMKFDLGDPWPQIMRIDLGAASPQTPSSSAIGRGERNRVAECLARMEEAVWAAEKEAEPNQEAASPAQEPLRGFLKKIRSYFF